MAKSGFDREQLRPLIEEIVELVLSSPRFKRALAEAIGSATYKTTAGVKKSAKKASISKFPSEGLAKVTEAAEFLSVSRYTVYRMVDDGQLPFVMVRDSIRIPWTDLHGIRGIIAKVPR